MKVVLSGRYKGEQPLTQFEQVERICLWWGIPPHSDQQEGWEEEGGGGGHKEDKAGTSNWEVGYVSGQQGDVKTYL